MFETSGVFSSVPLYFFITVLVQDFYLQVVFYDVTTCFNSSKGCDCLTCQVYAFKKQIAVVQSEWKLSAETEMDASSVTSAAAAQKATPDLTAFLHTTV